MPAEKNVQDGKAGTKTSEADGPPKAVPVQELALAATPPHQPNRTKAEAKALTSPAAAQRLAADDSPATNQRHEQDAELLRLQRAQAYEESGSKATEHTPLEHADHFESVLGRDDADARSSPSLRLTKQTTFSKAKPALQVVTNRATALPSAQNQNEATLQIADTYERELRSIERV